MSTVYDPEFYEDQFDDQYNEYLDELYYNGLKSVYLNSYSTNNQDVLHSHDNIFFVNKLLSDNSTYVIYYEHEFTSEDIKNLKLYTPNKITENLYYLTQIIMKINQINKRYKNDTKV